MFVDAALSIVTRPHAYKCSQVTECRANHHIFEGKYARRLITTRVSTACSRGQAKFARFFIANDQIVRLSENHEACWSSASFQQSMNFVSMHDLSIKFRFKI